MAIGWANVKGKLAKGENGSVQYNDGVGSLSGSSKFVYDESGNTLTLTGSFQVSGSIYANELVVDVTNKNIVNISATGSTIFGNSTSDTHKLTGSFFVSAVGAPPIFNVDIAKSQSINLGARFNYRSITTSRLTSSTSDYILGVGSTGSIELRLATAASHGAGAVLLVKDETASRAGSITLSSSSPNTIDGAGFYEITGTMPAISLYSNGSHWFVF